MYHRSKDQASVTDRRRAIELVANGLHPETGEPLHSTEIVHDGTVVRALFAAVDVLRAQEIGPRKVRRGASPLRKPVPKAAGRLWNRREDEALYAEFERGDSLKKIASSHARTTGAISARLVHLGLTEDD